MSVEVESWRSVRALGMKRIGVLPVLGVAMEAVTEAISARTLCWSPSARLQVSSFCAESCTASKRIKK